jgi:hypothetical protein
MMTRKDSAERHDVTPRSQVHVVGQMGVYGT